MLLNYGEKGKINKLTSNLIDLATPQLQENVQLDKDSLNNLHIALLFCWNLNKLSERTTGTDGTIGPWENVECEDISREWMYGVFYGRHYGVSFIVKRDSESGRILENCKNEVSRYCDFDKDIKTHGTIWRKFITLTGEMSRLDKQEWEGSWKSIRKKAGEEIVIGKKFDITKKKDRDDDNCNAIDPSVGSCRLGAIDVSSYSLTEKGLNPIWSTKFRPKISWTKVRREEQITNFISP